MGDYKSKKLDGVRQGGNVKGIPLKGFGGMTVFTVPSRGGDVLDVRLGGESLMMRNPRGHVNGSEIDTYGLQMVNWVEGFTTCGLDNAGGPQHAFPGHGTFSRTPLWVEESTDRMVRGTVHCVNLVTGPYINVRRTVSVRTDRRAFTVRDELTPSEIANGRKFRGSNPYMLLYHPNFHVADGDRLFARARRATSLNLLSNCDMESFATIGGVGRGAAAFPPFQPLDGDSGRVRDENFERCYVLDLEGDRDGEVKAALVSADGERASYIAYNLGQFKKPMAFQFWRNPRGGCAGLEIGTCFMGRAYAQEHGLMMELPPDGMHVYEVETGFLRGRAEVEEFLGANGLGPAAPELVRAVPADIENGNYFHKDFYKSYL